MDTYIKKKELAPGIVCYKNVFRDSYKIIDHIYKKDLEWSPGYVAGSRIDQEDYDKNIIYKEMRDVDEVFINHPKSQSQDNNILELNYFGELLYKAFKQCEDDYIETYNAQMIIRDYESYHILRYRPGQHFSDHVDNVPGTDRLLSLTYYFNDDYKGGELIFPRFDLKIKPEKNDLLLFPSMWVYNHIAKPVKSGIRYALVNFIR